MKKFNYVIGYVEGWYRDLPLEFNLLYIFRFFDTGVSIRTSDTKEDAIKELDKIKELTNASDWHLYEIILKEVS